MKRALTFAVLWIGLITPLRADTYKIDPDHSTIQFRIRHLVGYVTGRFDKFEGTFDYTSNKPESWKTSATIDAASINTNVVKRDNHLRSADFFDVQKYPTITFKSTRIADFKGTKGKLYGDLTIHGITRAVALDLEVLGTVKDPSGQQRASFEALLTIDRKDYGLTWNKAIETGGVMVGDDVHITLDIDGVQQK